MNNYNYYHYNWVPVRNMNTFQREMPNYNQNLENPKEGFEKGNLFTNLYSQYKNYQPAILNPKNEKEKLLMELQAIGFAAHDLNLYLDIYPNDQSMIMLLRDYMSKKDTLTKEYEKKYGPLTVNSSVIFDKGSFEWEKSPWPWEV